MKIAYLSHSPLLTQVANAIHVMQMCAAFAHLGHEVCLYARGRPGRTDDLFRAYGLEPARFRIALLPRGPWRFVGRSIYALMQVVRARVLDKPELYYARCPASAAFALLFGDVVLEIHELPRSRLERGLQRLTLKHPRLKRVVTISRALLDDLERAHRGLLDRVDCVVAPDGATLRPEATPFRLRRGPGRQIGYAGGLRPGNGICTIIALAEALPRDTFHVLGGAEDEVAAWRARQRSSNIVWYGHRDPACVPAFLESCDVLLAPYETGPKTVSGQDTSRWMSPLKIFEYMAAGRAMIVSDYPVLREVLEEDFAELVPPGDIGAWLDALRRLEQPTARARLGERARAVLAERYTWIARAASVLAGLAEASPAAVTERAASTAAAPHAPEAAGSPPAWRATCTEASASEHGSVAVALAEGEK